MAQRYVKVCLAVAVGLLAAFWCINNLINWKTAVGAVAYALSQQNHSGYSVHIIPPIENPFAAILGLIAICAAEATAGFLSLLGAGRMWRHRAADEVVFASAKQSAIGGAGVAVLTWFLGFQVIGGAGIMMGQAEGMEGAMRGAFTFGSYSFLTLIYLSLPDPKTA